MTCAGRSRSRSLALLVSARTCCTWSSGKVLAITPRLIRALRRMPAGRPEGARAIVAARPRESASMTQLHHYVNSIGTRGDSRTIDFGSIDTELVAKLLLLLLIGLGPKIALVPFLDKTKGM